MNKLLALLAVLLCVSGAWGACTSGDYRQTSTMVSDFNCGNGNAGCYTDCALCSCKQTYKNGSFYYTHPQMRVKNASCYSNCSSCRCSGANECYYQARCTSQAEADSVNCVVNPSLPGCIVETDTMLFACSDFGNGKSGLFRLACRAQNGVVVSCNGKTDVDVEADGTLIRPMQGTCAQNGFESGIVGGASADSPAQEPQSANADCFAVVGGKCYMRDKASGNTFSCDCDGSCDKAIRDLILGSGCSNPYPQPNNDSLFLGSSASTEPQSSGGSTPSSSEGSTDPTSSGGGAESSSAYDPWSPLLQDIKANTQGANNFLSDIRNNTETANGLLQAIVNKDWSPTINVGSPVVNVAGDTNIINVSVTGGDTARAPSEINRFLRDTSGIATYEQLFGEQRDEWNARADSIKSSVREFLDSMEHEDTSWVKHGSDVDSMVSVTGTNFRAYMDTIENMPFNDTLNKWVGMITNNGVITGGGSNACPSLLTRHHVLTIGQVSVDVGSLGGQLCTPIAGLNVTLWSVARAFLRFVVAFGCMVWIYCEVVGVKTTGGDDE